MNIIDPSFEILDIPEPTEKMEVLKFLEKIGRTCYKSEDKITDDSCIKFITMLKNRKHWAMLEHYIFIFAITRETFFGILDLIKDYDFNYEYIEKKAFIRLCQHPAGSETGKGYILSASATALNYIWDTKQIRGKTIEPGIGAVLEFMMKEYPELMLDPKPDSPHGNPDADKIRFITHAELRQMTYPNVQYLHQSATVKFITDRGISHEIVRHRPASYAQESTRYVNYGNKGMQFIKPSFFKTDSPEFLTWYNAMINAEKAYNELIENGAKPEEARSVLPNSIKTEIVMTARFGEWRHFFKMRADNAAHPQMRELAKPLLEEFALRDMYSFGDIVQDKIAGGIK